MQVLFEIQRDQFIWQQFIIEISSQLNLFQELVSCLMFVHGNGMENVVIFIYLHCDTNDIHHIPYIHKNTQICKLYKI